MLLMNDGFSTMWALFFRHSSLLSLKTMIRSSVFLIWTSLFPFLLMCSARRNRGGNSHWSPSSGWAKTRMAPPPRRHSFLNGRRKLLFMSWAIFSIFSIAGKKTASCISQEVSKTWIRPPFIFAGTAQLI